MTATRSPRWLIVVWVIGVLVGLGQRGVLSQEERPGKLADLFMDFEHLPDGSPTVVGPIGNDYAEWGVRFLSMGMDNSKSPTYSKAPYPSTCVEAAMFVFPPGVNLGAYFDRPVYAVSAYVASTPGQVVRMIARDAAGTLLGVLFSPPIPSEHTFMGPFEVTSTTPISYVEWWANSTSAPVAIDDLRIVVDETDPPRTAPNDGPGHLVACWDFNEGQGNTAHDSSGNGNDGTLHGPVKWATGHEGMGLSFAGPDSYLRVENSSELNATGAVSIGAWIKPAWTSNNRILQKGGSDNQYGLLREGGDTLAFDLAGVAGGRLEHSPAPAAGEWTHVAATYDGSAMTLYYNAKRVGTQPGSGFINTGTEPLYIGTKTAGAPSGDEYRGLMDDLRIYNRALTAGQIEALVDPTPGCDLRVTDVRIVRGQLASGRFQRSEEVNELDVGDVFQIVVEVTNMDVTRQRVGNLYEYQISGSGTVVVIGQPCVGVYPIYLDPGESALLDAFCPGTQAFQATEAGRVDMDIDVSEGCHDVFSFYIPQPCQPQITGVKIMRAELPGGESQTTEEVDEVRVGDLFQIVVEVTNGGDSPVEIGDAYGWTFSGQGGVEVYDVPHCFCPTWWLQLQPGESASLTLCCRAFRATAPGWVMMDIAVGNCHYTFPFEILHPCQPQITDVKIVRLVGPPYHEAGEVDEVTVGDFFTVKVQVTNQGDTPVWVGNPYEWTLSGQGDAEVISHFVICASAWQLQPGESATLAPFCEGSAFLATTAGSATMDIARGNCHYTFPFEILDSCQPQVTDVKIMRVELSGGGLQTVEEVDELRVGELFQIVVEVTNTGTTTQTVSNLYGWAFSGAGDVHTVGRGCIGVYPIPLAPGESAILQAFCPRNEAFQAVEAGWVVMDISVGSCQHTISFKILPADGCQPEITKIQVLRLVPDGQWYREAGELDRVSVGDYFTVKLEVANGGDSPVGIGNVYGSTFSGQGGVEVDDNHLCMCLSWWLLQPGESASLIPFCGCWAFHATASGWVTMDVAVHDCHHTFVFEILPAH